MRKISKRTKYLLLTVGAFCAFLLVGGLIAFFTETEQRTNAFTVGKVSIELTEEDYTDSQIVYPNEVIAKNPCVENTGKNDAYVFLVVDVPKAEVTLLDSDGTLLHPQYDANGMEITNYAATAKSMQEIFKIIATPATGETAGIVQYPGTCDTDADSAFSYHATSAWTQLVSRSDFSNDGYNTYVFYYSKPLSGGSTTKTLFDKVQLRSFVDSEYSAAQDSTNKTPTITEINVNAYAIQSDNLENMTNTDPTKTEFYVELYEIILARL